VSAQRRKCREPVTRALSAAGGGAIQVFEFKEIYRFDASRPESGTALALSWRMDIDSPLASVIIPSAQFAQPARLAQPALPALPTLPTLPAQSAQSAQRFQSSERQPVEISLIDLVIAATDLSDDEFEVSDGIESLIRSGAVSILSREHDAMQQCLSPGHSLPTPHPAAD
jgi:hypothetical protein